MRTIHKQSLQIIDSRPLFVPAGSILRSFGNQRGQLCVWYECDTDVTDMVERRIWIIGTGNRMPSVPLDYLATVIIEPYVWHVYEQLPAGSEEAS